MATKKRITFDFDYPTGSLMNLAENIVRDEIGRQRDGPDHIEAMQQTIIFYENVIVELERRIKGMKKIRA